MYYNAKFVYFELEFNNKIGLDVYKMELDTMHFSRNIELLLKKKSMRYH